MPSDNPPLLEVVPWNYGFAHSWALRWLLHSDATRDALMRLLVPDGTPPWTLTRDVVAEHRIPRARADLAVFAADATGREERVAVETKVADAIKPGQLAAYSEAGFRTALYVPGTTGLLMAAEAPFADERWITGGDLAGAVADAHLPPMIASYVDAVDREARRMDVARSAARGDVDDFPQEGQAPYGDVEACAWVAEVARALRARGAQNVWVRVERHDRGIYWDGARVDVGDRGAYAYIDVVATIPNCQYAVIVKAMGGDVDARRDLLRRASELRGPDERWRLGRPGVGESQTIWRRSAQAMTAGEAADTALAAQAHMQRLADRS